MNAFLVTFVVAALASLVLTRACRDLARRLAWFDVPDAHRKFHAGPIPAVGGVALLVSTALAVLIAPWLSASLDGYLDADWRRIASIGGLGTTMMVVGLVDDLWPLGASLKMACQIVVAVAAWLAGIRIETLGSYWGDGLQLQMLSLPITVVWLVGVTNAFNLLDGIDGLAAGAALFATTALMGVAIVSHETTTAVILAAVAGATAGFLRYNFNPASIFLGDSGSLLLGFTLAVLSVQSSQKSAAAFAIAVPIVSLGLPVLDTTVVVLRRVISGTPVFSADRRHIHHLLLDRGLSAREVAIWMYAACGALALVSLLVASPYAEVVGPVLVILGVVVAIGIQQLQIPEVRALNSHVVRSLRRQRPLLSGAAAVETMSRAIADARDGEAVLAALGRGLADSGVKSATLAVPAWMAPLVTDESGWRQDERPAMPCVCLFDWGAAPPDEPAAALVLPLFKDGAPGHLTVRAAADDVHQAALISWIGRDVAQTVGRHLARVSSVRPVAAETAQRANYV